MSEREDIKTIRHFVYKAGKWNDSAEEYANDTGVYDALDRIETALAARDAGAVTDTQRIDWLADQPVFDNIGNYPLDVYELSCVVAEQRGRMEPNADDQREAFRRLIDAALVDVVSRALARDGGDADA